MKDIYFIGSIVPESLLQSVEKISFASINYQKKVIKSFRFDEVLCLLPLNVPNQKKKFFVEDEIGYIHYKFFGSRIFKLVFDQIVAYWKISKKSKVVFYNVGIQNFILIYALKKIKCCKCFVIVADYVDVRTCSSYKKYLQKIINRIFQYINGAIILNSNIKIPVRSIVSEGIIDTDTVNDIKIPTQRNNILFSGALGYTLGVHIAIEAMNYLPDFNLVITGPLYYISKQEMEELLMKNDNNNIQFLGTLDGTRYLEVLSSCEFALNLRDPKLLEHQFNFPSKVLEYLSYNKKIVSTINYPSISKFLILSEFNSKSLADTIRKNTNVANLDSSKFVKENFGLESFSSKLKSLINDIN